MSKSSPEVGLDVVTVMVDPTSGGLLVDIGSLSELGAFALLAAAAEAVGRTNLAARVQAGSRTVWQGRLVVNPQDEHEVPDVGGE